MNLLTCIVITFSQKILKGHVSFTITAKELTILEVFLAKQKEKNFISLIPITHLHYLETKSSFRLSLKLPIIKVF